MREQWPEWTDMLGQTVVVGDIIAYGTGNNFIDCGRIERINKFNSKGEPIIRRRQDDGDPLLFDEIMGLATEDRMGHPRFYEWQRSRNWYDEHAASFTVTQLTRMGGYFALNIRSSKTNVKYPHLTIKVDLP